MDKDLNNNNINNKIDYNKTEIEQLGSSLFSIDFNIGEKLEDTSFDAQQKITSPKPRYKEASLIKELQKKEIGRPSTYATIIETVLSPTRGYCELVDKYIVPTEKGIQLANFLDRAFPNIINYDYTKQLEEELDTIAAGNKSKLDLLNEFFNILEDSIKNNNEGNLEDLKKETKLCPKCGAPMVIRRSRFGKLFYGCSKYPECNGICNINE